ncbi:MAG: hypothetical protein A3J83_06375 [Elusimicrobia bacterium RIFOXYA2_FULL_40_6]|nr:MAG: hypothetical protein A3J83_06375 [Elusimicrobia bacterium RIFOXYA2_FULL_40_6]
MLTYENLIAQAKTRNMPPSKMRGVLREYLQILIMKQLNKVELANKMYFTGGTYLRLVHDLKRFSEDLDFNTAGLKKKEFENVVSGVNKELSRVGIKSEIEFEHWDNLFVSKIIFPEIEKNYNVISKYSKKSGIIIKFETNRPRWAIKPETRMITGFGEFYPCACTQMGALFADKIDALCKKNRGRHLYDIIFMLSNKYPIDNNVIKSLGIKGNPLEAILNRVKEFSPAELSRQAEILRPFLFEESEADLIVSAHKVVPLLVEKYRKAISKQT